jgi:hypothetical protein
MSHGSGGSKSTGSHVVSVTACAAATARAGAWKSPRKPSSPKTALNNVVPNQ